MWWLPQELDNQNGGPRMKIKTVDDLRAYVQRKP